MVSKTKTEPFDLVILAGGLAARLGPIAARTPKSLLPVNSIPFMALQLAELARTAQPRRVIVMARKGTTAQFIKVCKKLDYQTEIIEENAQLGTGGAILQALAIPGLSDPFVVANGDVFFRMNVSDLLEAAGTAGAAIAGVTVPDVARFGALDVESNRVIAFREKGASGPGLINAGLYAFTRRALESFEPGSRSFETDIAPVLANAGKLAVVLMDGPFIDIGTPETYRQASNIVRRSVA